VIDEALAAFLERGCAMVVGTVDDDGWPHAQRGWGCRVLGPSTVRILLDDTDRTLHEHIERGGPIAVTSADVRDLRSVQLKGTVTEVEPAGPDDLERCERHNDELFDDILQSDFYPRHLTERMVPPGYVAAVIEIHELFDQTPGPRAGTPVGPAT
jgi:hypothetical protein